MERVKELISQERKSRMIGEKEIEDAEVAILKEMADQASETGIVILKTPAVTYTLTNMGVKKTVGEIDRSIKSANYNNLISDIKTIYLGFNQQHIDCKDKRIDWFTADEYAMELLRIIADKHKFKITGKYLPKNIQK
jgi:hypothetical protein